MSGYAAFSSRFSEAPRSVPAQLDFAWGLTRKVNNSTAGRYCVTSRASKWSVQIRKELLLQSSVAAALLAVQSLVRSVDNPVGPAFRSQRCTLRGRMLQEVAGVARELHDFLVTRY